MALGIPKKRKARKATRSKLSMDIEPKYTINLEMLRKKAKKRQQILEFEARRTFTIFPKLPPELRLKIFKAFCSPARIFIAKVITYKTGRKALEGHEVIDANLISDDLLAMMQVCRDARAVGQRAHNLSFPLHLEKPLPFNEKTDTLLFANVKTLGLFLKASDSDQPLRDEKVLSIAIVLSTSSKRTAINLDDRTLPAGRSICNNKRLLGRSEGHVFCDCSGISERVALVQLKAAARAFGCLKKMVLVVKKSCINKDETAMEVMLEIRQQLEREKQIWDGIEMKGGKIERKWAVPDVVCYSKAELEENCWKLLDDKQKSDT